MGLKCPSCQTSFHPQLVEQFVAFKKNGATIYICYQLCPDCDELITGYKEMPSGKLNMFGDTSNLILLKK